MTRKHEEKTGTLIVVGYGVGLEVSAGQNRNMMISNRSFENVA
jgi:hypothetical protein